MPPDSRHAGGIWLAEFARLIPDGKLDICLLVQPGEREASKSERPYHRVVAMRERGLTFLPRRARSLSRPAFDLIQRRAHTERIVREIAKFANAVHSELLLVTLTGPTTLAIASQLGERLRMPLLTLVWDPPEYYLQSAFQLNKLSRQSYVALFGRALSSARACIVMTDAMKARYEQRYGARCIVAHHGLPRDLWRPGAYNDDARTAELVIAYAGSMYARQEWHALLAALDKTKWRIAGRDVRVRLYGAHLDYMAASVPRCIEFLGWHDEDSTVAELSRASVAYLPYWFDQRFELATRLCFPTKLSTYVAAGCPILFHGPPEASAATFVRDYELGTCCHSVDADAIVSALERVADPKLRPSVSRGMQRALEEVFDARHFREAFAALLDVPPNQLSGDDVSGTRRFANATA